MAEEDSEHGVDPAKPLLLASDGFGPLLERNYWGVIRASRLKPSQVMKLVSRKFAEFAPAELCRFARTDEQEGVSLTVGDELDIDIMGAGFAQVRVIQQDMQSFTVATLEGHPEAGRVTFGSYRNVKSDVIFHIRSRARSSTQMTYLGFLAAGEPMQTNTWTDFVSAVATTVGAGVVGEIQAETQVLEEDPHDDPRHDPTFVAQGD